MTDRLIFFALFPLSAFAEEKILNIYAWSGEIPETIIQQFENQLIYPLVVRKIVGVPPLLSILALIVGYKLAGFVGLLISVPLATMLVELLNDIGANKAAEVKRLQSSSKK